MQAGGGLRERGEDTLDQMSRRCLIGHPIDYHIICLLVVKDIVVSLVVMVP